MRQDQEARTGVKAARIGEVFADGVVRQMSGAAQHALLHDPGIGPDLEHVEIVIGFKDKAIGLAEMDSDVIWEVAEIRADGNLCAVGAEGKSNGVGCVVRDGERVDVDIADRDALYDAMEGR